MGYIILFEQKMSLFGWWNIVPVKKKKFAAQFYHLKTWQKKVKNKSAKEKNKWTSLQKNYQQKIEQVCKKNIYGNIEKNVSPPIWFAHFENKPKTSHRHHTHTLIYFTKLFHNQT